MINRHLERIRTYEIEKVASDIPKGNKILEIGAGAGWQARRLSELGYKIEAIDVALSTYTESRAFPVKEYDGIHIPFLDHSFDVVFSSSVLEHVKDMDSFNVEVDRVLKDDGRAIHVLPNPNWRFWTSITHFIKEIQGKHFLFTSKKFYPKRHGERGNFLTEMFYFSHFYWKRLFSKLGWEVVSCYKNRLFYTGNCILDSSLSINVRRKISFLLGSVCSIYVLKKAFRKDF